MTSAEDANSSRLAATELNPLDRLRDAVSNRLSPICGVAKGELFRSLSWTPNIDKGDLVLATPRLRMKTANNPEELCQLWADEVRQTHGHVPWSVLWGCTTDSDPIVVFSSPSRFRVLSLAHLRMASTFTAP
jgi:hypothetical protein